MDVEEDAARKMARKERRTNKCKAILAVVKKGGGSESSPERGKIEVAGGEEGEGQQFLSEWDVEDDATRKMTRKKRRTKKHKGMKEKSLPLAVIKKEGGSESSPERERMKVAGGGEGRRLK